MGLGELWWLLLVLFWLFGGAMTRRKGQRQTPEPGPKTRRPSRPVGQQRDRVSFLDTLRRELEQLQADTDGQRGPLGRRARGSLPEAEDVEERESLEIVPVPVSLEDPPQARGRALVDFDDDAARVARARVREAEARNRALTLADHQAFDRTIRETATEPDRSAARLARARLRQAIVWKEVLSAPVALRDGGHLDSF